MEKFNERWLKKKKTLAFNFKLLKEKQPNYKERSFDLLLMFIFAMLHSTNSENVLKHGKAKIFYDVVF